MSVRTRTRGKWESRWAGWRSPDQIVARTDLGVLQLDTTVDQDALTTFAPILCQQVPYTRPQPEVDEVLAFILDEDLFTPSSSAPRQLPQPARAMLGLGTDDVLVVAASSIVAEESWATTLLDQGSRRLKWTFAVEDLPIAGTTVPGVGPAGSATFALSLQEGTKVTLEWSTDVSKSWNGKEQRRATIGAPRQTYSGTAVLVDAEDRIIRSALVPGAAQQAVYLLGLTYEEVTITADATTPTISVTSTTKLDWANPGQRVVLLGRDGTSTSQGVVQSSTATTITLDVTPSSASSVQGSTMMPAMAVYLSPKQGFGRYPANATDWDIEARAALFGFANVDQMGVGAAITTWVDAVSSVTFNVFDRRLAAEPKVGDSMQSLSEIVDLGGSPLGMGATGALPDWGREISLARDTVAEWQWLKRFVYTVRGRQVAFLLPSWRPDLVFHSTIGPGAFKIKSASFAGAGNYLAWFNAGVQYRRIQALYADGSVQYLRVSTAGDNGDGTVTLGIGADELNDTPVMLSLLELVRLEDDAVTVTWSGYKFTVKILARVVQQ